jgi:hypothetical protein
MSGYEKCPPPHFDWCPPLNLHTEVIFLYESFQKLLVLKINYNKLAVV